MRIYDGEYTVGSILEECRTTSRDSALPTNGNDYGVDLHKLAWRLKDLPVQQVRKRRTRLNSFYEEMLVSADPDRGINFSSCLMTLAHYNIITDSKSLRSVNPFLLSLYINANRNFRLEEFLRRRTRLQRVQEAVRRNVVVGFFNTLYWSRRFRRHVDSKGDSRIVSVPQFSVPEIYIEDDEFLDQDNTPEQAEREVAMLSPTSPAGSPRSTRILPRIDTNISPEGSRNSSLAPTPTRAEWSNINPALSPVVSPILYDSGEPVEPTHRQEEEHDSTFVRDVMDSLDNSAWGESIRRSFTLRRSPHGSTRES